MAQQVKALLLYKSEAIVEIENCLQLVPWLPDALMPPPFFPHWKQDIFNEHKLRSLYKE